MRVPSMTSSSVPFSALRCFARVTLNWQVPKRKGRAAHFQAHEGEKCEERLHCMRNDGHAVLSRCAVGRGAGRVR